MAMKIGLMSLALEMRLNGCFKNINSVFDLGFQTLHINYDKLENLLKYSSYKFDKKKYEILKKFPKGKRLSTKLYWESIGVENYFSSDINKKSKYYIDLNLPLNNNFINKKYDLVTDFGNNEHVFNISEAYNSMLKLCNKNGYLWIYQSVTNGNGYFNFDISFFEGFAAANKLGIIYSAYVIHTGDYNQFLVPCDRELLNSFDQSKIESIYITYIMKKRSDDNLKYYYQYSADDLKKIYTTHYISSNFPSERYYIPSKSIKDLKKLAKKGDSESINWLRTLDIKF